MSLFPFRNPHARTPPQRDLSAAPVYVTTPAREAANDALEFDLTGFHAVEDYIRDELKAQGLMRGDGEE
jgi:hypothetical protein